MRKIMVVAVREYQAAVKTKAFLISLIIMPVIMGGSIVAQRALKDRVDTSPKNVVIIDQSGEMFPLLAAKAEKRNAEDIYDKTADEPTQVLPKFMLSQHEGPMSDVAGLTLELSDRVRNRELFAFVVIDPDPAAPIEPGAPPPVRYYSNSPTNDDVRRWISGIVNEEVRRQRLAAADLDPTVVAAVTSPVPVSNLGLVSLDEAGNIEDAKETNRLANIFLPLGLLMLMFMIIMVGAPPLMNSVLEEKMQRIAEVLIGSIPPFQLMMGKLIGTVGVSLTMATVYLVGAWYAVNRLGYADFLPAELIWWFVVYLVLAVFMFGSLFIAIGASVTEMKEAQSYMTPVMLMVMFPMFIWVQVVKEPNSSFSMFASLFPPATPMLMTIRQAVPPGIPVWQPLVGVILVALTSVVFVFIAGRVFRIGILMQGRGATPGELVRWILKG